MTEIVQRSNLVGATLLVAGACVGGGMLALPVETGVAGFFPSLVIMFCGWAFMTLTGLLLVEANLWMEEGAHTMTMSSRLLGPWGKWLCIILYLFMGYGSLIAYNSAGADLIGAAFSTDRVLSAVLFAVVFGLMFYLGTEIIGRINTLLVVGMVIAYVFLVGVGIGEARTALLSYQKWMRTYPALPLILATFSYQMIVPSLTPYLKRDPTSLKKAVVLGTTIPFAVYAIWQWIVLGTVPIHELNEAYAMGKGAIEPMRHFVQSKYLLIFSEFFAFFALVTSYLAIGLGTYDFIADMTGIKKEGLGKICLGAIVVLPSLFFALVYAKAFLVALGLTGGFGDSILNGLMPISMVWVGRYKRRLEGPFQLFGGKRLLILLALFALTVLGVQIWELLPA